MTTATVEKLVDEELGIDLVRTQEVLLEARWWLDQCVEDKAGYVAKLTKRVIEEFESVDADLKSANDGYPSLRWFCNGIETNNGRSIPSARATQRTMLDVAAFVLCGWEHEEMPKRIYHLHQDCWRIIHETEAAIVRLESGRT